MERRETPVRERPGRRREQHPEGPAVPPASAGRRGVCAAGGHSAFRAQPAPRGRGEVLFLPRHCGMCPNKTQNRLSATVKTFLLWKGTL